MTREQAKKLVSEYLRLLGIDSPGLSDHDVGGVMVGAAPVTFIYEAESGQLKCAALIYRFKQPARPEVIAAFAEEHKTAGEMRVEYLAESRALCLTRTYHEAPAPEALAQAVRALVTHSVKLSVDGAVRVAERLQRA